MPRIEIGDWDLLEVGREYELRSGGDVQRGRFLGGLTEGSAQFEIDGRSDAESFDRALWHVFEYLP